MIKIIGAGLAGCEAAWQCAEQGVAVTLYEQKPNKKTPAHHSNNFAELCCSNSLRGARLANAPGLLKEEMRRLGSLIIDCADKTAVPAGGALAVDREKFSLLVTEKINSHPLITVVCKEVCDIPKDEKVIIASGPLTDGELAKNIQKLLGGQEFLNFYDAAAPLVSADSIDMNFAYRAARYGRGGEDYINCPLTKEEFEVFREELANAEESPVHGFEDKKVFEGCMPVEVMARRGTDTLRFGSMRPIGLRDPKTDKGAYAVLQLRQDNAEGTVYNMVGFQTHLKFPEQKRVFSLIPALANAEFLRFGVMHRNSFINSPRLLDENYRLKTNENIYFAGQITGVEGYIESAASGLTCGRQTCSQQSSYHPIKSFPQGTAIGALGNYIANYNGDNFQPSNINFGLLPTLENPPRGKQEKNLLIAERALKSLADYLKENG